MNCRKTHHGENSVTRALREGVDKLKPNNLVTLDEGCVVWRLAINPFAHECPMGGGGH